VNSRDSMPDGGTLTIRTSNIELQENFTDGSDFTISDGEYVKFSIEDTGGGIDAESLKKIFEPFYTTKPVGEGTGLGLAAVYGTVQNHRGVIKVSSQLGKGTCFDIYFPVHKALYEAKSHKVAPTKHTGKQDVVVLVIDDEKIVRTMANDMLENIGYGVLLAEDGIEGIKVYREMLDKIDLIFLDMIMPDMGGAEVFHEIRKINPEAKVVITSGFTSDRSISGLLKDGALGFLEKPYKTKKLADMISYALGDNK
jgi:two-component system, cell cycle sensor histidine kinase and response regulator CckA